MKCPYCHGRGEFNERSFGMRLRTLRQGYNETQESLAAGLQTSRGAIAHLEWGRRQPSIRTLKKVAEHFNVTLSELLAE